MADADAPSDHEGSPEPAARFDDEEEGSPEPAARFDDEEEEEEGWLSEWSPTPVYDEDKAGKAGKRLVKKGGKEDFGVGSPALSDEELDDWQEEDEEEPVFKKRKAVSMEEGKGGSGMKSMSQSAGKASNAGSKGYGGGFGGFDDEEGEDEIKELWDAVAGGDSEDDQDGMRTADDEAFIDDTGVDPAHRTGSDNEHSAGNAPQAEEGEENDAVSQLLKGGKRKKKNEKSPAERAVIVEHLMAELEVIAEEDAELNKQNKPAINKLRKLPMLIEVMSKKNLQQDFLDHGVLTLIKNWLEPLPDGSLPNMNVRAAILKILADFPIDLEQHDRREQLKRSGIGKVIMFLSKSDEETTSNRKLAKELVDKWSRPIFNKRTRFEDMRTVDDDDRAPYKRPSSNKPVKKSAGLESRDDDLDLGDFSQGKKPGQAALRAHASRPEALALDFIIRPQSKIDPEEIRARAKVAVQDQRRLKMNKKLQQLKAPKRKQLQATKLSVEGRGMVKYL